MAGWNDPKLGGGGRETELERARKLPRPVPGVRVSVPLELVPAYLRLYGLTPAGFVEPDTLRVSGDGPLPGLPPLGKSAKTGGGVAEVQDV